MNVRREFYKYVIPSMLAFALSGVYAIADGFFVGNALGDSALAAINIAYPITALLQAAGTGIGMGGAIQYSISLGAGDRRLGRQYLGVSCGALMAAGILLTILFLSASPILLRFFGASDEIYGLALEYIRWITAGALFQILATGLVPFIRNMDGALTAMSAMIAGFLTNIFLDYLLVWRLPWGMTGAAAATVVGQTVTLLVCLAFFIVKKEMPVLSFGGASLDLLKKILQVGLSPFGLTFSPNITLILVNKSAALVGGAAAVTCYAPISYISAVVILLLQGVSDGSQPLLSLSCGEGKMDKTKAVRDLAYRFSALVSVICIVFLFLFRENAALLFGASAQITRDVAAALPIFLCGYLPICISRVTIAYFYATGENRRAYFLIYGDPLSLGLLLLILPPGAGIVGTWLSVPLSQLFAVCLSVFFLRRGKKSFRPVSPPGQGPGSLPR